MVKPNVLIEKTWDAVRKTINKFRENPYYFFTESDIHSYFYHCLYSTKFQVKRENRRIYLVHREYPTNFRYIKKDLVNNPICYDLGGSEGRRGNYDMAVINPEFANKAQNINHIINKNIKDLIVRNNNSDSNDKELLFAIEFKYIISNKKDWVNQVALDNQKLKFALDKGAEKVINLVFCNKKYSKYNSILIEEVKKTPSEVNTILVRSFYENEVKITPKPISNNPNMFNKHNIPALPTT